MLAGASEPSRVRRTEEDICDEVGQGRHRRFLTHRRSDQISKYTKTKGLNCSRLEKEVTNMKKEKLRMNSVVLDWNGRYWWKCMDFNIYNNT